MTATDAMRRTGPPGLRLLAPGDEGWDAGRATFNLLDDQQPALARDLDRETFRGPDHDCSLPACSPARRPGCDHEL